jgi:hypothetical protein
VVTFADKHAVRAQAILHKARVFEQNALQPDDFIQGQAVPSSLQDGTAPSFEAVARGRSPSTSKLALLSAGSMKLAVRETR